jgi:hypothetical protein
MNGKRASMETCRQYWIISIKCGLASGTETGRLRTGPVAAAGLKPADASLPRVDFDP